MKIKTIEFNWIYTHEVGEEYYSFIIGEEFMTVGNRKENIGRGKVIEIEEHRPRGEGDKLYYNVHFEDSSVIRIFNVNCITYEKIEDNGDYQSKVF